MVRSLGFLGVRTAAFAGMTALYRNAAAVAAEVLGGRRLAPVPVGIVVLRDPPPDERRRLDRGRGPDGNVHWFFGPDGSAS